MKKDKTSEIIKCLSFKEYVIFDCINNYTEITIITLSEEGFDNVLEEISNFVKIDKIEITNLSMSNNSLSKCT
jgi:hypothetical protein